MSGGECGRLLNEDLRCSHLHIYPRNKTKPELNTISHSDNSINNYVLVQGTDRLSFSMNCIQASDCTNALLAVRGR